MAEDKGSDLDVFEGLTKKQPSSGPASQAVPAAPGTIRGGVGVPPPSRPLPPPKKPSGASALPMPKPPPSKRSNSGAPPPSAPASLPLPKAPPSRASRSSGPPPPHSSANAMRRDSEGPVLSVKPASLGAVFDQASSTGGILPGHAIADLDWDDEEESTSVFDRSNADLFGDLAGRPRVFERQEADDTAKRAVGGAAALLASSGRPAPAIKHATPEPMPRIPAPAPVPRDISEGRAAPAQEPPTRAPHPSWAPSMPPPAPQRSSMSTIILALVAVVVIGVAAFFYLRNSSAADVMISVTHQGKPVDKANIYVDGQKKCEFAPCKLKLEPGAKSIRVVSGSLAGTQTLQIEGGKDVQVAIELGVASDVAPPPTSEPVAKGPATLKIASGMKDVDIKVFVNDQDKGKLPVELKDLPAGEVKLRFEGGDKYGKIEKTVKLDPGATLELKDIKLPLLEVKVELDLDTRGAEVKLVKDGDDKGAKKVTFRGTKATETLDTSHKWTVKASLKGYKDFEKELDFSDVGEKMDFSIKLEKEDAEPPPASVATGPATTGPSEPPPTVKDESGYINANSIPPSKVIIDGRPKGSTPVTGVKVAPGSHSVVFKHKKYGTKSRTVTVAAGQTKTATVRFKKPKDEE